MTLTVTIVAGIALAIFTLAGALRDLPRGILVLAGVLLGAALVSFWAAPLASNLVQMLGNPDRALLRRFTSVLIFSVATLLGFGSGVLLPRVTSSTLATRLGGMILGAFSGALAVGYVLRYTSEENPAFLANVQASVIGGPLHDQLPLVLAGAAIVIGVVVVGIMITRMFTRRAPAATAQQTNSGAQPSSTPNSPPLQRSTDQRSLDKINQRMP